MQNLNLTNKDDSFRMVVQTTLDDKELLLEFDEVESSTITTTSTITNHPLVNGDFIADHMYRNPVTISVSGIFSLNGNQPFAYLGSYDRLTNIEEIFEKIKNRGLFCTIMKMSRADNKTLRFLKRDFMVLTSISWTENQNSLGFAFTFTEAITANIVEPDEPKIDKLDENLPALTGPKLLDFTDTLLDWKQVDIYVIQELKSAKLLTDEFLTFAMTYASNLATGVLVGTVAAVIGVKFIASLAATVGATNIIAGAIIVGISTIIFGIKGIIDGITKAKNQHKYKVQAFKKYKDDKKNQAEVNRFYNFIGSIHQNLEYLEKSMKVYGIERNEQQECTIYIDDYYYSFVFTKNNDTSFYGLRVTTIDETGDREMASMKQLQGLSNLGECKNNNRLFRTIGSGSYVYVLNLKLAEAEEKGYNQSQVDELNKDLTNFVIFVSELNMEEFNENLKKIVVNAMTY